MGMSRDGFLPLNMPKTKAHTAQGQASGQSISLSIGDGTPMETGTVQGKNISGSGKNILHTGSPTEMIEKEKTKIRQMVRNGEEYKSVRKLKSGADSKNGVKGVTVQKGAEWKQPLRRHINPATDTVEFVTILVRVLSGDSEHDFHARFPSAPLYARKVCEAIAERERLSETESSLFSLWVISKDLEIQIRPDQDIFELMVCWHRWVMKYTHFPEAEDPAHHVNRHWFIYRREAVVSLQLERDLAGEVAVNLLFGEAKRNILTKRYVCSHLEAATLAGYQLQMAYGDWSFDKSSPGYLTKDDRLDQLLPMGMSDKMRPTQWEEIITVQYKSFIGIDSLACKQGFLEFIRRMTCYGCSFFPVCAELPPSAFFEFRTQNWFLGAGPNGMCIVDSDIQKYVYHFYWKDITFRSGPDQFFIYQSKGERVKEISLITPQGKIIENLATKLKYSWAKETGRLKSKSPKIGPAIIISEDTSRKQKQYLPIQERKNSIAKHGPATSLGSRQSILSHEEINAAKRQSETVSVNPTSHHDGSRKKNSSPASLVPIFVEKNSPEEEEEEANVKPKVKNETSIPIFTEEEEEAISEAKTGQRKENTASTKEHQKDAKETSKTSSPSAKKVLMSETTKPTFGGLLNFSRENLSMKKKSYSNGNLTESSENTPTKGKENQGSMKKALSVSIDSFGKSLTKNLSTSIAKLLIRSDEMISPNTEKVKISAAEVNFMIASETIITSPKPAEQDTKILPKVEKLSIQTSDFATPDYSITTQTASPSGTSEPIPESKQKRKPANKNRILFSKRATYGFGGSSNSSAEGDLLSQLDDIATSAGVNVHKKDCSKYSNNLGKPSLLSIPLTETTDEPDPLMALEQPETISNIKAVESPENLDIEGETDGPITKNEVAASLKTAPYHEPVLKKMASPSSVTSLPVSSVKSSQRRSRDPSVKPAKKSSKFGKIGGDATASKQMQSPLSAPKADSDDAEPIVSST